MPSKASAERSARPTAWVPPVLLRTSPARAPMRCKSAGASRAMAWPMSSTRASATRSERVAVGEDWVISFKLKFSRSKLSVRHDLFDVFNVPPHGRLCRFSIVALEGSQDSPVPCERLLRAPFHLQRLFSRVAQQVHQSIDHFQHDAVAGSESNAVVKFRVLGDGGISLTLRFFLPLQNFFHLGDFIDRGVGGGARG